MIKYLIAAAALSMLAGCSTLQKATNPFATAYSGFDKDGDGVISKQEAQGTPGLANNFDKIDTNSSGSIDQDEYAAATADIAQMKFEDADINQDGVISEREATAMPNSLKAKFATLDTDGDGNVSPSEYQAAQVNVLQGVDFASLDADSDDVVGPQEAEKMPALSEEFSRVDTNGDGLVSPQEFEAAQR